MIKNIIFDFGGVLLDLDYNLTYKKMSEITGLEISEDTFPPSIIKVMMTYEKGQINTETFLWNLQKESSKLPPQAIDLIKAWNAMLLGWNKERFQFLRELKKDYSLYLLSNTNELHIDWVMKDLEENHLISDFDNHFFDKTYYSHLINKRKPDTEIYKFVLEDAGIKASETLFIDDNLNNVEAARKCGIHAIQHESGKEIIEELPKYLKQVS